MASETYGRGQVAWAAWQVFLPWLVDAPNRAGIAIPSEFQARIKKLWEFGIPIPPEERPGTGTAIHYTPYHGFELVVALKLWDLGIKQADAADAVLSRRGALQRYFAAPFSPAYLGVYSPAIAEAYGPFKALFKAGIGGVSLDGFEGILSMEVALGGIARLSGQGVAILEVGGLASGITEYLAKAPEIRRGRP